MQGEKGLHLETVRNPEKLVDPAGIALSIELTGRRHFFPTLFCDRPSHGPQSGRDSAEIRPLHGRKMLLFRFRPFRDPFSREPKGKRERQITVLVLADDVLDPASL